MGDIIKFERRVTVALSRFGNIYTVYYEAGATPEKSPNAAALHINGQFATWLDVNYHSSGWEGLYLDLDNDFILVDPEAFHMPSPLGENDQKFLLEAEEYTLTQLQRKLIAFLKRARPLSSKVQETEQWAVQPYERSARILRLWHDQGKVEQQLEQLLTIEMQAALRSFGEHIIYLIKDSECSHEASCVANLRDWLEQVFEAWHG